MNRVIVGTPDLKSGRRRIETTFPLLGLGPSHFCLSNQVGHLHLQEYSMQPFCFPLKLVSLQEGSLKQEGWQ